MYKNILTSPNYDDFRPRPGETKLDNYKYTKKTFMIM